MEAPATNDRERQNAIKYYKKGLEAEKKLLPLFLPYSFPVKDAIENYLDFFNAKIEEKSKKRKGIFLIFLGSEASNNSRAALESIPPPIKQRGGEEEDDDPYPYELLAEYASESTFVDNLWQAKMYYGTAMLSLVSKCKC